MRDTLELSRIETYGGGGVKEPDIGKRETVCLL